MRVLYILICILFYTTATLSASAKVDTLNVAVDSLCVETQTIEAVDSLEKKEKTKEKWYTRAYKFCDRILSPQRDTNYIDVQYYYNWCAQLQFTSRFEHYEMDAEEKFHLAMSPQTRHRIGPFFGWRWAFFGYNFDLKTVSLNSDDTDIGGSIYSAAFGLDLFYRRVGGTYKLREFEYDDVDYSQYIAGRPFDGINIGMTRINFYYILNYKHYSRQAAFNQTNRQIRSAGSPILGFSYAHNRMTLDVKQLASMVPSVVIDGKIIDESRFIKNDEYALTGGYAYNWVFAKNWLAAGEITGSLGYVFHHTDIQKQVTDENIFDKVKYFYRKNVALNGNVRLALLYNNGPWFAGTQAVFFSYKNGNGNVETWNSMGTTYLYVGCNF